MGRLFGVILGIIGGICAFIMGCAKANQRIGETYKESLEAEIDKTKKKARGFVTSDAEEKIALRKAALRNEKIRDEIEELEIQRIAEKKFRERHASSTEYIEYK